MNGYSFLFQCDPAYSANMFMDLMMDTRQTALVLGAACSDVTEILAELSAYRNLVQVKLRTTTCALNERTNKPRTNEQTNVQQTGYEPTPTTKQINT